IDLFDSPVICEYLDSQHKGRQLFPRKGRDRWVALRLQAMADGLLDAALLARYEGALRPEEKRWPEWSQGQMKKINGVLDLLEAGERSRWHRVDADELWHHYAGASLELALSDDGHAVRHLRVGTDFDLGELPQAVVPRGVWQAARSLGSWTLVGCTVAPAFR